MGMNLSEGREYVSSKVSNKRISSVYLVLSFLVSVLPRFNFFYLDNGSNGKKDVVVLTRDPLLSLNIFWSEKSTKLFAVAFIPFSNSSFGFIVYEHIYHYTNIYTCYILLKHFYIGNSVYKINCFLSFMFLMNSNIMCGSILLQYLSSNFSEE